MNQEIIKSELEVNDNKIRVITIDNKEYISLTDLARYANPEEPKIPVQTWMRNKDVIAYLGLWEKLNNENFKGHEFTTFENSAGKNSFYMSPQKWIKETNAVGIISKSGNNGGTYARSDIALEFASWLSPEFKLYVIQEFERLKRKESYQYKMNWSVNRVLAKTNYRIHTDSIKQNIIPKLTESQKKYVYAEEADVLNVALFGMTAKEWKENNPDLKGNIRDYTDLKHLLILCNLENTNAELINDNIPQNERLIKLNNSAIRQMKILENDKNIKELEILNKNLIATK
ncbi:MAG: KilA-N domain-containing protein [Bacilli bacterium]